MRRASKLSFIIRIACNDSGGSISFMNNTAAAIVSFLYAFSECNLADAFHFECRLNAHSLKRPASWMQWLCLYRFLSGMPATSELPFPVRTSPV